MAEHLLNCGYAPAMKRLYNAGNGKGFTCMLYLDAYGRLNNIYTFTHQYEFRKDEALKILSTVEGTYAPLNNNKGNFDSPQYPDAFTPGQPTPPPADLPTFEEAKAKGMFNHLEKRQDILESLKSLYGKSFKEYRLTDNKNNTTTIEHYAYKDKPAILSLGTAKCLDCQNFLKEMHNRKSSEYTFLEAICQVKDLKESVSEMDRTLEKLGLTDIRNHIFYDIPDHIYEKTNIIDTPCVLYIDRSGRVVNASTYVDFNTFGQIMYKSFGLVIEGYTPSDNPTPKPEEDAVLTVKTDKETYKRGEYTNYTAEFKDKNQRAISGANVTFTVRRPDGTQFEIRRSTSWNGIATMNAASSASTQLGQYTVTAVAYYNNKAYTATHSYSFSDENTPDPVNPSSQKLYLNVEVSNTVLSKGNAPKIVAKVSNKDGRAVQYAKVTFEITRPSGSQVQSYNAQTSYNGEAIYTPQSYSLQEVGKYDLKVTASGSNWESDVKNVSFEIKNDAPAPGPDPQPSGKLTFEQRDRNGEFRHLSSQEKRVLQYYYGKNIKDVKLTNYKGSPTTIGGAMSGNKPVMLGLGSDSCGYCQRAWGEMASYSLSEFDLIEVINSYSVQNMNAAVSRAGASSIASCFYLDGGLNRVIEVEGYPTYFYLDKEGNITNYSGHSHSNYLTIIRSIGNTISTR